MKPSTMQPALANQTSTPRGGETACVLTIDGVENTGRMDGVTLKQADGSIQVHDLSLLTLSHNKLINITRPDGKFSCYSRSMRRNDAGTLDLTVNFSRSQTSGQDQSAMLLNCYIRLESSFIICMPVEFEDDISARVQLWDKMQFRVPKTSLTAMTRAERFESLGHERHLKAACDTYGFSRCGAQQDRVRVFLFEFGEIADCTITKTCFA